MKHYLYITDDLPPSHTQPIQNVIINDLFSDVTAPIDISVIHQLSDYAFYTFGDIRLSAPRPLPFLAVTCSLPDDAVPRDVFNTYNYVELPIYPQSIRYDHTITSIIVSF